MKRDWTRDAKERLRLATLYPKIYQVILLDGTAYTTDLLSLSLVRVTEQRILNQLYLMATGKTIKLDDGTIIKKIQLNEA